MNKIHNNLTIENLIKTDSFKKLTVKEKEALLQNSQWFNQFQELQQQEILKGLKANLDISIYAKEEFDWKQMWQIRLGLTYKVDISVYLNGTFDWQQMFQINDGLIENIDVSKYANPKNNWQKMLEIKKSILNEKSRKNDIIYTNKKTERK